MSPSKLTNVSRGEIDTTLPLLTDTKERREIVDFAEMIDFTTVGFLTRKPKEQEGIHFTPLSGLTWGIWLALFGCSIGIASVHALGRGFSGKKRIFSGSFIERLIDSFLFFTGQTSMKLVNIRSRLGKVCHHIVFTWGLTSAILAGLYASKILITLMKDDLSLPFINMKSLSDCIETKGCFVSVKPDSIYYHTLLQSTDIPIELKQVQKALRKTGLAEYPKDNSAWIHTRPGYHVLFCNSVNAQVIITADTKHSPDAWYYLKSGILDLSSFAFPKNSNLKKVLISAKASAQQKGLLDPIYRRYFPHFDNKVYHASNREAISFESFSSTIFMLSLGFIVAAFSLLLELAFAMFTTGPPEPQRLDSHEDEWLSCLIGQLYQLNQDVKGHKHFVKHNYSASCKAEFLDELRSFSYNCKELQLDG